MLDVHVEDAGDYTLCRPVGELDAFTVSTFREAVGELTDSERLVIDLADVPFLDSAGLGAMIGTIRRRREQGGAVAVACDRENLLRLLHTTGFDRMVTVAPTVAEAADSFKEPADG